MTSGEEEQPMDLFEPPVSDARPGATEPHSDNRDRGHVVHTVRRKEQRHLQDILWAESLQAVRISIECSSVEELTHRLWSELPQNSLNRVQLKVKEASAGGKREGARREEVG